MPDYLNLLFRIISRQLFQGFHVYVHYYFTVLILKAKKDRFDLGLILSQNSTLMKSIGSSLGPCFNYFILTQNEAGELDSIHSYQILPHY